MLRVLVAGDDMAALHAFIPVRSGRPLSPGLCRLVEDLGVAVLRKPFDLDALLTAAAEAVARVAERTAAGRDLTDETDEPELPVPPSGRKVWQAGAAAHVLPGEPGAPVQPARGRSAESERSGA